MIPAQEERRGPSKLTEIEVDIGDFFRGRSVLNRPNGPQFRNITSADAFRTLFRPPGISRYVAASSVDSTPGVPGLVADLFVLLTLSLSSTRTSSATTAEGREPRRTETSSAAEAATDRESRSNGHRSFPGCTQTCKSPAQTAPARGPSSVGRSMSFSPLISTPLGVLSLTAATFACFCQSLPALSLGQDHPLSDQVVPPSPTGSSGRVRGCLRRRCR